MTRRAFIAIGLVLLLGVVGAASGASPSFTPEQRAGMEKAVEGWKRRAHYPGLSAGLWESGIANFETAVGVSDRESGRRLRLDHRFPIGSITKTMTATLVLQLVERSKLRLRDPVRRYVRWVPNGGQITIRELLNMTSGIRSYTAGLVDAFIAHPHRDWRPGEIARRMTRKPRYCPARQSGRPSCYGYSDSNYILLGQIIKRVTDQPLPRLFERRIFDPLGMSQTSFRPRHDRLPRPAAHGYIRDPDTGRALDTSRFSLSYAWTAGGAVSTLRDLRRWALALATGRGVLGERMQEKRLRFVPIPGQHGDGYGLGIFKFPAGPFGHFLGHDGQPIGYDALAYYAPRTKITIAALGNTSAGQDPLEPSPLDSKPMETLGIDLLEALGT
jgi:D-alanyl-D-alanine carboxypeptidase